MRIHFPNGESADYTLTQARATVGAEAGLDIVIDHASVKPRHVAIEHDAVRGITLEVLTADAQVYVNGRLVRQKAMLRLGDLVVVGKVQFVLKPDSDFREKPPEKTNFTGGVPRVLLRGVSGGYSGRALTLGSKTVLGRDPACQVRLSDGEIMPQHAVIENTSEGLFYRDQSGRALVTVNGVAVRDAILKPGDQLSFGSDRFLVEAPGYALNDAITDRHHVHTGVMRPISPAMPPPTAPKRPDHSDLLPAEEEARHSRAESVVILVSALVALAAISLILYLQFFTARG